ncbi:MAG: hypothetical protein IJL99_00625 [Firmicutes bacterium]|nr:hypothetical protein [Bacillota bacterium]
MTLTVLILIYLFAVCLALGILYGPLRKALDPEHRRAAGTIVVSAVFGVGEGITDYDEYKGSSILLLSDSSVESGPTPAVVPELFQE